MSAARRILLGLSCLWATPALAQTQDQNTPAQSLSEVHPFVTEIHTGLHDPLGQLGLALVYDPGGRLVAGFGLGLDSTSGKSVLAASLFGRMRLLRQGIFSLDAGGILSRGSYQTSRTYSPPSRELDDELTWTWNPDYRLTGTVAAELAGRRWSLRLEGGVAYHINDPTCTYANFRGDCNSQNVPEAYHFSREPGRISPSVSLTLGYRLGVGDKPAITQVTPRPEFRSPSTAQSLSTWSTAIPVLLGLTLLKADDQSGFSTISAVSLLGLGISFGPSIGYGYADEYLRGVGMGMLRATLFGLGSYALVAATSKSNCEEDCAMVHGYYSLIGYSLIGVSAISAAYDIIAVPKAAERTNARHRHSQFSVLPVPIAGPNSVGPGLALAGRF